MAVTITKLFNTYEKVPTPITGSHLVKATVAFDNSYPTGGEAVDLQDNLGLPASGATITSKKATITAGTAAGFASAEYDTSTEKCLLYQADGTQATNASDASSVVVEIELEFTV